MSGVIWHDLDCGGYVEDLTLWHELAGGGPVLDVGCGTGRVALALAGSGIPVVGLDREQDLLDALTSRAAGLPVETACADARTFSLGRRFPVILAPMQTVQLLGGPAGRAELLQCVREHLEPGGVFAAALADGLEGFDEEVARLPLPDVREQGGTVYFTQVVGVKDEAERVALHRVREIIDPDGGRTSWRDVIRLDRLEPAQLEEEAQAAGLTVDERRTIPATDEFVGSVVVVLRA